MVYFLDSISLFPSSFLAPIQLQETAIYGFIVPACSVEGFGKAIMNQYTHSTLDLKEHLFWREMQGCVVMKSSFRFSPPVLGWWLIFRAGREVLIRKSGGRIPAP